MFAKSFFAIALVALSVSASPVQVGTSEAALLERSLVPEFMGLDKRESRSQAAGRVAIAKQRAAKKAKRALQENEAHILLKRAVAEAQSIEPVLSKREIEAREISRRALRTVRCGISDAVCQRAALPSDIPANGRLECSQSKHTCIIGCNAPFQYRNGVCVASAATCGSNVCPTTPNGIFLCGAGNRCTLFCNSGQGYASNTARTACFAVKSDAENCGRVGNACPASYNGVGSPRCVSGRCRLSCPAGTAQTLTGDRSASFCG